MVNAQKGVIIKCDPAMHQFLIHLDETKALGSRFMIKKLDDTHIFVEREIIKLLESRIDALMDSLSPSDPADK